MAEDRDEEQRGFKVHDRRRFADSGEPREEEEEEEAAEQHDAVESEPAPAEEIPQPAEQPDRPQAAQDHEARHGEQAPHVEKPRPDDGPPAEMTFATFVISLSTQALALLGEIPDPAGATQVDLASARQLINILGMLQDKTRGNLDTDEGALLEHALYDLRMKYVERAQ